MSIWITLSKVGTSFVIAQLHTNSFDERWSAILRCVAEEFECDEGDLSCEDDDEGREFATLNGKPIAEIHDGYISRLDFELIPVSASEKKEAA